MTRWRTAAVNCQLAAGPEDLESTTTPCWRGEAAYAIANAIDSAPLTFAALHNIGIIHHEIGEFKKAVEVHRRCQKMITAELDAKRAGWASYPSVSLHTFLQTNSPA